MITPELVQHFASVTKLIPLATRRANRAHFEPLLGYFGLPLELLEDQRKRRADLGNKTHWAHKRASLPTHNVRFVSLGDVGDMSIDEAAAYVRKTPNALRAIIAVKKKYSVLMREPTSQAEDIVIVTKIKTAGQ